MRLFVPRLYSLSCMIKVIRDQTWWATAKENTHTDLTKKKKTESIRNLFEWQNWFLTVVFRLQLDVHCVVLGWISVFMFATCVWGRDDNLLPNWPLAWISVMLGITLDQLVQSKATGGILFSFFPSFYCHCTRASFLQTSENSSGAATPVADRLMCLISGSTAGNFSVVR